MKKNKLVVFLTIILTLTIVGAILHFSTRESIPEDALKITYQEKEIYVDIHKLDTKYVEGERVDGKGDTFPVEGEAVLLKDLLKDEKVNTFKSVTVIADDSYSAEVMYDEIMKEDVVYLFCDEESVRLMVFTDKNSKRNVTNVVEIEVE